MLHFLLLSVLVFRVAFRFLFLHRWKCAKRKEIYALSYVILSVRSFCAHIVKYTRHASHTQLINISKHWIYMVASHIYICEWGDREMVETFEFLPLTNNNTKINHRYMWLIFVPWIVLFVYTCLAIVHSMSTIFNEKREKKIHEKWKYKAQLTNERNEANRRENETTNKERTKKFVK